MSARRTYPQDRAGTAVAEIRRLRHGLGLTARELGKRCNPPIHHVTILKNEAGTRLLTVDEMYRLALALEVSVDLLITGECDGNNPPPGHHCFRCSHTDTRPPRQRHRVPVSA